MWEELDHKGATVVHMLNVIEECMRWSRKQGGAHRTVAQACKRVQRGRQSMGLCAGMCA